MLETTIDFYWDAVSPYTYLANELIIRKETELKTAGVQIRRIPAFLHGVHTGSGNAAPLTVPAKGKYLFKDLFRQSSYYGIPLTFPSTFPTKTIPIMRVALYANEVGQAVGDAFARKALAAYWAENHNVDDLGVIRELAHEVGLDPEAALSAIQDPVFKDRLKQHTDEAVQRGAFGMPAFFVGEEHYFGHDRLDLVWQAAGVQ